MDKKYEYRNPSTPNHDQWEFNNFPYDAQRINQIISNFKPHHFNNPQARQQLRLFAEEIGLMNIKQSDIANMSFQSFSTLKSILSVSLNELSISTQQQRLNIQQTQSENRKLENQLQKLNKIEYENLQKQKQIQEKLQRIKYKYGQL